ncbi:MAG: hypothetical protein ABI678_32560 [Kofleriaceae bacterium]
MKAALVAVALMFSCARHPALTVGIAGGSIGLLSCEIQQGEQTNCGIITAAVGLGLGGLAWLVTTFADTDAHALPNDDEVLPDGAVRVHSHTELPPVPLDAGVIDAASVVDAGGVD